MSFDKLLSLCQTQSSFSFHLWQWQWGKTSLPMPPENIWNILRLIKIDSWYKIVCAHATADILFLRDVSYIYHRSRSSSSVVIMVSRRNSLLFVWSELVHYPLPVCLISSSLIADWNCVTTTTIHLFERLFTCFLIHFNLAQLGPYNKENVTCYSYRRDVAQPRLQALAYICPFSPVIFTRHIPEIRNVTRRQSRIHWI